MLVQLLPNENPLQVHVCTRNFWEESFGPLMLSLHTLQLGPAPGVREHCHQQ